MANAFHKFPNAVWQAPSRLSHWFLRKIEDRRPLAQYRSVNLSYWPFLSDVVIRGRTPCVQTSFLAKRSKSLDTERRR